MDVIQIWTNTPIYLLNVNYIALKLLIKSWNVDKSLTKNTSS